MDDAQYLAELKRRLREKLKYTKKLIEEYEETMDYASHCNLVGFAEGIEFTLEEIEEAIRGNKRATSGSRERSRKKSKR